MKLKFTYHRWYLLIVALLSFSACTERVDIELDSTFRRLVVEGAVTSDSLRHYVNLSYTSDYFSNEASPPVRNAYVELSFGDESVLLSEDETIPGRYVSPAAFRGIPGTTYELDISQMDADQDGEDELYHASGTMPGGSDLDRIELRHYPTPITSGYVVFMYGSHPPEQRDWFGFKLMKNSDVLTDSLNKYTVLSDDLFDTGYFPGMPVGFLSDDDPRQAIRSGDTVTFELNCIEQAYFNFVTEAQLEISANYPLFSGPPANVPSNIDNGAMGIFAVYSIQRSSLIVE